MKKVAVVGAGGYVGSALAHVFGSLPQYELSAVTRENYAEMQKGAYDFLINAAMPSGRFWAKNNPAQDFLETVKKTADLIYGWKYKKFVQISSISARSQLDTVYGRHKAAAEKLCTFENALIVRLGPMYSYGLKKGVLMDMLDNKTVFVDGESRYCFTPLEYVTNWISSHLDRSGIVEVGAHDAMELKDVARHIGADISFEGAVDHQEIENPPDDAPDSKDVLRFLDAMKKLPTNHE